MPWNMGAPVWFHRRSRGFAVQGWESLEQADRDVVVQRTKHAQEEPLRQVLLRLKERNHLAEKFGEVLSQHRPEE